LDQITYSWRLKKKKVSARNDGVEGMELLSKERQSCDRNRTNKGLSPPKKNIHPHQPCKAFFRTTFVTKY